MGQAFSSARVAFCTESSGIRDVNPSTLSVLGFLEPFVGRRLQLADASLQMVLPS
jgi:hypothetical protein